MTDLVDRFAYAKPEEWEILHKGKHVLILKHTPPGQTAVLCAHVRAKDSAGIEYYAFEATARLDPNPRGDAVVWLGLIKELEGK